MSVFLSAGYCIERKLVESVILFAVYQFQLDVVAVIMTHDIETLAHNGGFNTHTWQKSIHPESMDMDVNS
jgi:hypothetical protein